MKTTYVVIIAFLALSIGCKNKDQQNKPVTQGTARNFRINQNNSYSDLFLDSNAVEQFISRQALTPELAGSMRNVYNARNFQFAWFNSNGLTEQALAFRSLYDFSKDSNTTRKALDNRLDSIMNEDTLSIDATDDVTMKTELMMTWRFINYANDRYADAGIREVALEHLVPSIKEDVLQRAAAVIADRNGNQVTNDWYEALRDQLKKYVGFARNGGWQVIMAGNAKYTRGTNAPAIALIKKRLRATGQFTANDTTSLFTDQLEQAVKAAQVSYGYTADGIIAPALVRDLNEPVMNRISQILINMERMRWMPAQEKGRLILVNIPEYRLHVWEGKTKAFDMDVVVGKQGHSTVMFSGKLNQIVFSPYWNLPQGIVQKEILPKIRNNSNYLHEKNMEVTGERNGVPVIRQLPGGQNELGSVKFLFPNSYDIYFHDTPQKWLFNKDQRAFSHGCIRLSDPRKMAGYLLQDMPEWTPEGIDSTMNSDTEQKVMLNNPVPVLIYYYTAWVDENGIMQFRKDIYSHDSRMASRMFTNRQLAAKW